MFVRFENSTDRDRALRLLRSANIKHFDNDLRCKPDLPIDKRFVYTVLFGLRWLLVKKWKKYFPSQVKVDMDNNFLQVMKSQVLTISFNDCSPTLTFADGWEDWISCEEWNNIVKGARDKLDKSLGYQNL